MLCENSRIRRDFKLPKLYAPDFRQGMLELVRSGRKVSELVERFGVAEATLLSVDNSGSG